MHRLGLVQEHLGLHPGVGRLGARLVEQDHQDDPLEVLEVELFLVQGHRPVQHQLALVGVEDAVLLQEQQETAGFDVELVELRAEVDAGRAVGSRRRGRRAFLGERAEPVEGLVDLGVAEAGAGQFVEEGAVGEAFPVTGRAAPCATAPARG